MIVPFIDLWKLLLAGKKLGGGGGGSTFRQVTVTEKIASTSTFTYVPENEEVNDGTSI